MFFKSGRYKYAAFAMLSVCAMVVSKPVEAQGLTKLRLAYLETTTMLPIYAAQAAGDYKKAGIDLQLIQVQGGPAVVAAVVSGAADIGYAAPTPPMQAALSGVPIKIVLSMGHEEAPKFAATDLIASKASGIETLAQVKGHKIALNAYGGLCELAWRDHLAAAGVKWSEVQPIIIPFPQIEAALQQGSVDAACLVDPFLASTMNNSAINAHFLAKGMLANLKKPALSDVIFASDEYAGKNAAVIRKFAEVTAIEREKFIKDHELVVSAAEKYDDLQPAEAQSVVLSVTQASMVLDMSEVQTLLDAMYRDGMVKHHVDATEVADNVFAK